MVDARTGTVLWAGRGVGVSDSGGGGDLVAAMVGALVNQVATSVSDPCPGLARAANEGLFADGQHGLLLGRRHPGFEEDQVRRRAQLSAQR